MKIVPDANIIIAALLGSRARITILTSMNHEFFAPEIIIGEIRKYANEICSMLNIPMEDFDINLNSLLYFINVVPPVKYWRNISKARLAIQNRDVKDADYIACALEYDADFIWTEDKDFSEQNIVPTKTTEKFIEDSKKSIL